MNVSPRARWVGIAGTAAVLLGGACTHVAPTATPQGTSTMRFVEAPLGSRTPRIGSGSAPREPSDTVIPAEPIPPLAQPTYPRTALAKQTIPVTVGVRITVDAEGRVADVRPSMLALSIAGGSATEFERAVEEALAQWRFKPAEAQHLVPKTDTAGNEFWQVTRAEKTTWTFDVSFAFSPGGDVRAGPGK